MQFKAFESVRKNTRKEHLTSGNIRFLKVYSANAIDRFGFTCQRVIDGISGVLILKNYEILFILSVGILKNLFHLNKAIKSVTSRENKGKNNDLLLGNALCSSYIDRNIFLRI